jgi:tetratricopeptide (TPR) repeat protein
MHDRALPIIERAIAIRPNVAEGYGLRSMILFAQEKWDKALKDLEKGEQIGGWGSDKVLENRKWESDQLVGKGHTLFKTDLVQAIDNYTLALRFFHENAEANCWRGIAYQRTGNPEAALADLKNAININPRLYDAYKGLDDLLFKQGQLDEIIESWTQFLRLEPGNANAYFERSGTYFHKKDLASAIRDLKRSCELGNNQACQRTEQFLKKR